MQADIPLGLTYDDVLIVPKYSEVLSRAEPKTDTQFSRNQKMEIPLVSANMDRVTEWEMAFVMAELGGAGVIHRNQPIAEQAKQIAWLRNYDFDNISAAVGAAQWKERASALVDAGVQTLVVDIAHGDSLNALMAVEGIKARHNVHIIAGNVVTRDAAFRLLQAGADAIKVGIGPGAACTTRIMTGVGYPQFSAIRQIMNDESSNYEFPIPIIADGGIKTPGDVAKALAAGASSVMIGNLFAGTHESPGELLGNKEEGYYKEYRGMASTEASGRKHAEGVSGYVDFRGSVVDVVEYIMGGLRSAMSYVGATNLTEFREKAEFVRVTNAGLIESAPHDMREYNE